MGYRVLKGFTAYPNGKKTRFVKGGDAPSKELIDECNMVENGLVALVKEKNPNEAK